MPYTLDDITPAERARLGTEKAQTIIDEWNANEAAAANRKPVKTLAERVADVEAEIEALKAR